MHLNLDLQVNDFLMEVFRQLARLILNRAVRHVFTVALLLLRTFSVLFLTTAEAVRRESERAHRVTHRVSSIFATALVRVRCPSLTSCIGVFPAPIALPTRKAGFSLLGCGTIWLVLSRILRVILLTCLTRLVSSLGGPSQFLVEPGSESAHHFFLLIEAISI